MRNFVSFEWEIGNREHLTRDFFSLQKCHKIYLKPWLLFRSLILFLQQEFLNNSDDVSYVNINNFFLKKLFVLSSWNTHQTLLEAEKNPVFFLCCSNDVELNMSIVKFEFEFTRLSAFTMTWQSSFYRDTKTNYGREESDLKFMMTHSTIANVWILMVSAR